MVLDSKLELLRDAFSIAKPEDWTKVSPASVIALDGIGDVTLNHLRLHLAAYGLTLADDKTPAYWQEHLSEAQVGSSVIAAENRAIVCPFTIAVDVQEKHPWMFSGITTDASQGSRPLIVPVESMSLGPTHGDYSICGLVGEVHIERKSIEDAQSTILGWGERRERFLATLEFLAGCHSSAVIVEGSFGAVVASVLARGKKTKEENKKILHRQVLAWQQDFGVPWIFCDTRRMAELTAFHWLRRYAKSRQAEAKQANKPKEIDAELASI